MKTTLGWLLVFAFVGSGRAADPPRNSALVPVPKLEEDSYKSTGTISREVMADFRHPTEKGYGVGGEALAPWLVAAVSAEGSTEGPGLPPTKVVLWPEEAPVGDGTFEKTAASITVYRPARPNGAAVVICPGGGYGGLVTGPEGVGIAEWLNRHGMVGIVLEYRLPRGRPFVPLLDAQRAIRTARTRSADWGCDPRRLGIMGFSAGGHLAATAATHFDTGRSAAADPIERVSCRPDFAVLVYPVITMGDRAHGGSKDNLLGPSPTPETVACFSNERQVTAQTPPTFLAHALDDTMVLPDHSRLFYEALQAHRVPSRYLELPSGGHGLNGYQGPMWEAWQTGAIEWLTARKVIPTP